MYVIELIRGWDWKKHNVNYAVSVNFQSQFCNQFKYSNSHW